MRILSIVLFYSLQIPCAAQLFDTSRVTDLHLDLAPGQWERLQTDFLLDTYYEANLRWESENLSKIGIRSRGNGSRLAAKPGLKLDFGKYAPNQALAGFKSLVLDNLVQDSSMMAEFLSFQMFGKMGIPAPRLAYVRLFVNGRQSGLYTIVEPVDKLFLKRALGEDAGFLYDYEWATEYWFHYAGPDPALYSPLPFTPKTNEKSPDPQPIVDMIRILNEADDEDLVAAISPYINLYQFLDYLATETYLAERDGLAGDWGLNNFYLYRQKGSHQFIFIPWDKDNTFDSHDRPVWQNLDRNVLTRRLLEVPEYRDYFFRALDRCASLAGGDNGWLYQEIECTAKLIAPFALADRNKPYSAAEVEESFEHLRQFAAVRAAFVRDEIGR